MASKHGTQEHKNSGETQEGHQKPYGEAHTVERHLKQLTAFEVQQGPAYFEQPEISKRHARDCCHIDEE
jgi:hypothetical protein